VQTGSVNSGLSLGSAVLANVPLNPAPYLSRELTLGVTVVFGALALAQGIA